MSDRIEFREERKLLLDYWKTIISFVSVVAIALATYQWYYTTKIYRDDLDNKMVAIWIENVKLLVDKPNISPYFVSDRQSKTAKSHPDGNYDSSVIAFADLRLETIDYILNNIDSWSDEDNITWKSTFINAFLQSKILCERFLYLRSNFDNISEDLSSETISETVRNIRAKSENLNTEYKSSYKHLDKLVVGVDGICESH